MKTTNKFYSISSTHTHIHIHTNKQTQGARVKQAK